MAMSVGSSDGEEQVNSTINTTPLVDVMLVLLIIFLLTIPVVSKTVPVKLPTISNTATKTKPENIIIAVDEDGNMFWNNAPLADANDLFTKLKDEAVKVPQPEVHIRGDLNARYEFIGRVMVNCQRAGIVKVGFITLPDPSSLILQKATY
jgi:biopolymer transport protein ExbD